jgi:predicted helicase
MRYGLKVIKEDIFYYYICGLFHCPGYRRTFAKDPRKMSPRLLSVEELTEIKVIRGEYKNFAATKMSFPAKRETSTINYNAYITISNIPEKAYQYITNGRSTIEWIVERCAVTIHRGNGIKNDPNDWAIEPNKPWYILDLLSSVVTVSIKTVDIVAGLLKVEWK